MAPISTMPQSRSFPSRCLNAAPQEHHLCVLSGLRSPAAVHPDDGCPSPLGAQEHPLALIPQSQRLWEGILARPGICCNKVGVCVCGELMSKGSGFPFGTEPGMHGLWRAVWKIIRSVEFTWQLSDCFEL